MLINPHLTFDGNCREQCDDLFAKMSTGGQASRHPATKGSGAEVLFYR